MMTDIYLKMLRIRYLNIRILDTHRMSRNVNSLIAHLVGCVHNTLNARATNDKLNTRKKDSKV